MFWLVIFHHLPIPGSGAASQMAALKQLFSFVPSLTARAFIFYFVCLSQLALVNVFGFFSQRYHTNIHSFSGERRETNSRRIPSTSFEVTNLFYLNQFKFFDTTNPSLRSVVERGLPHSVKIVYINLVNYP